MFAKLQALVISIIGRTETRPICGRPNGPHHNSFRKRYLWAGCGLQWKFCSTWCSCAG